MLRLGAIFIVLSMVLIAASLGAVLFLLVGLSARDSMIVALAALTALAIYNAVASRLRDRTDLGGQIADLSRGTGDLARQVAEIGRRTALLEGQGDKLADSVSEKARIATEPVSAELGELSALVRQLAETVALHEVKIAAQAKTIAASAKIESRTENRPVDPPKAAAEPAPIVDLGLAPSPPAAEPPVNERARKEMIEIVRNAVEANRADLYLQPIVTLPQRKVRYYEAYTRLRAEDGIVLQPSDFLDAAEVAGLMPRIDKLMLFRSVQVVRRLQLKNREIGVFCNIALSTLNDQQLFPEILQFMDANRALAPSLVLEFKQSTLRTMGPLETESLAALREIGFRFCMDRVTDLRMEPRDLGERGIRYVKVPAPFLLGQAGANSTDIHAADLSDLLGRYGVSLIAERIETEAQVVDLLEYDVRFGQGFLFSHPRPVRSEALRGGDAADATGRDNSEKTRGKIALGRSAGFAF